MFLRARIHPDGAGERVPLTIPGTDVDLIRISFMAIGTTTKLRATISAGDCMRDVVWPLGMPTDSAKGVMRQWSLWTAVSVLPVHRLFHRWQITQQESVNS